MDTSLEEIYSKHPFLVIKEDDDKHIQGMKSELVMVLQMTEEEREQWRYDEWKRYKQSLFESLVDEYRINQSIKATALRWAKRCGLKVRMAIEDEDEAEARKYVGYLKTAKDTINAVDEDQIRVRREIKQVRSRTYGTKNSRR